MKDDVTCSERPWCCREPSVEERHSPTVQEKQGASTTDQYYAINNKDTKMRVHQSSCNKVAKYGRPPHLFVNPFDVREG